MQPRDQPADSAHAPDPRRTGVVIPVRALEGAKSRLGAVLDAEERRELVALLLRRTVEAARGATGVDLVAVVSADDEALNLAAAEGAVPVRQRTAGLNPGLVEARDALAGRIDRLLVLPADVPGVTPREIEALLDAADTARRDASLVVVLATDRHGRGTNALLLDPPGVIEPSFGGDSRLAHRELARARGAAYVEVPDVLEIDLDTADDLLMIEAIRPEALHVH